MSLWIVFLLGFAAGISLLGGVIAGLRFALARIGEEKRNAAMMSSVFPDMQTDIEMGKRIFHEVPTFVHGSRELRFDEVASAKTGLPVYVAKNIK